MTNSSEAETPTKKINWKRWQGLIQIGISAALLVWLFNTIGLKTLIAEFAGINIWLYLLAVGLYLLTVGVRAVRWQIMLKPLGVDVSLWQLFRLYLLGFFWDSFLPTGFGGDVVKAVALRQLTREGVRSATSVVAERLIGLLGTGIIAVIVLAFRPTALTWELSVFIVLLPVGILVGIWLLRFDILSWLEKFIPFTKRLTTNSRVITLQDSIKNYTIKTLVLGLLVSLPFTIILVLSTYIIGLAFHVDLAFGYYALFIPIVSVVNLLPLSFNGLGIREYTYQLLFVPVGVSAEQAIAMALAFNLMRVGVGILGGLVSLIGSVKTSTMKQPEDPTDIQRQNQ